MIEIRPATLDDVDTLAAIWPAVHDEHARGFFAAQGFGPMYRRLRRPVK